MIPAFGEAGLQVGGELVPPGATEPEEPIRATATAVEQARETWCMRDAVYESTRVPPSRRPLPLGAAAG